MVEKKRGLSSRLYLVFAKNDPRNKNDVITVCVPCHMH